MSQETRNALWAGLPRPRFDENNKLHLPGYDQHQSKQILARMLSDDVDAWSVAASRVGYCSNPVHLVGSSTTIDKATGEVLSTYSSADEPLGSTVVRCGNRRESACPSCSRLYAADMFQLIRAGVRGGKTVPEQVADNPLVFATLTAPSMGPVHGTRDNARRCRSHASGQPRCEHGRPTTCMAVHADGDPLLGQPLCADCYDYASHVVWQWWAPELWRRFIITLRRTLAHHLGVPATKLPEVATVQYAKVAEYQRRGLVHFHALIRLDGPRTPDGFAPAPRQVTATILARLVREAVAAVRFTAPPVHEDDVPRVLAFGRQVDARPVTAARRTDDPGAALSPEQVAGYLAKYATKAATDTTDHSNAHLRRIQHTADQLGRRVEDDWAATGRQGPLNDVPYGLLGKWAHELGFRGHFATKSRSYSVTLGQLRRARRRAQQLVADAGRRGDTIDLAAMEAQLLAVDDDQATTVVIGAWTYSHTGWDTPGDAALAKAAAAAAREHDHERAAQRKAHIDKEDRQ
ncbi:plasmid replication initiator protein [Pedococcus ginsenosidimutans]|uniref:Plasmid replication initiator protein n=1 Tax=Pedococcus ginsenosidimutans TaxID=490570 RepID=A0ABP8Y7I4_9MICO